MPWIRRGYPVGFTKRITGLCFAEEGLLVKDITKSLTLSLPDHAQFMTNFGSRPRLEPPAAAPAPWRLPAIASPPALYAGGKAVRAGHSLARPGRGGRHSESRTGSAAGAIGKAEVKTG